MHLFYSFMVRDQNHCLISAISMDTTMWPLFLVQAALELVGRFMLCNWTHASAAPRAANNELLLNKDPWATASLKTSLYRQQQDGCLVHFTPRMVAWFISHHVHSINRFGSSYSRKTLSGFHAWENVRKLPQLRKNQARIPS